jgi:hypothetical protein
MMQQRVLAGAPATISVMLLDQNGAEREAVGDVTVEIRRYDGTEVTAGAPALVDGFDGTYAATLPEGATEDLDILTATWSDDAGTQRTTIEIVGGYYFSIYEARDVMSSIRDTAKWTDDMIVRARHEVEVECEQICKQAFVRRFATATLSGDGSTSILLPHHATTLAVRSLSVAGTALTTEQLATVVADETGLVAYDGGFRLGNRNVVVGYEHGWDSPPFDLKRAALSRLLDRLTMATSGLSSRTTTFSAAEGGTYQLAVAGRAGFETGNPDVDAVYGRYRVGSVVIA